MTVQECYEAIGGNYEDVLGRLHSEALIRRFTLKFLEDQSYIQLKHDHRISRSLHPAEDGRTDDRTVFQLDHHISVL